MSGLGRTTSWLLQHILLWSWRRHLHCWFSCRSWWNLSVIWQALLQLIRFWNTRLSDKLNLGFISVGFKMRVHTFWLRMLLCAQKHSAEPTHGLKSQSMEPYTILHSSLIITADLSTMILRWEKLTLTVNIVLSPIPALYYGLLVFC